MPKTDPRVELDDYTPVADRIALFYSKFPTGRITTKLLPATDHEVVVKAFVYREGDDRLPAATGLASERFGDGEVNMHSCLENTETSAIGRALANLGFAASRRRPSREEMEKAARVRARFTFPEHRRVETPLRTVEGPTADLVDLITSCEKHGLSKYRAEVSRLRATQNCELPAARIRKVEVLLRAWLRRREL